MKFKVGQRVRIVRSAYGPNPNPAKGLPSPIGREATIVGIPAEHPGWDCSVIPDDFPLVGRAKQIGYACMFASLEPLQDPGFESFMERIQKPLTKPEWEAA